MAIKVIKGNKSAREEARIMQKFDHPNVVKFLTSIPMDGNLAIVMQLCSFSLSDELKVYKNGLPETRLLRFVNDFTNGYAHIRDKHILHMDIKPGNILCGTDYNYKIADFGTAEIVKDGDRTTMACGTYAYCHPLIFEKLHWNTIWPNKPSVYRRFPPTVDLWSIGITLYQAATGQLAFRATCDVNMYTIMTKKPRLAISGYEDIHGFQYLKEIPKSEADPKFIDAMKPLIVILLQVIFYMQMHS